MKTNYISQQVKGIRDSFVAGYLDCISTILYPIRPLARVVESALSRHRQNMSLNHPPITPSDCLTNREYQKFQNMGPISHEEHQKMLSDLRNSP